MQLIDIHKWLRDSRVAKTDVGRVTVIGVLNGEVERPDEVSSTIQIPKDSTKFAVVDVVGIITEDNTTYQARGKLLVALHGYLLSEQYRATQNNDRKVVAFNSKIYASKGDPAVHYCGNFKKAFNNTWELYNVWTKDPKTGNDYTTSIVHFQPTIDTIKAAHWDFSKGCDLLPEYYRASEGFEFSYIYSELPSGFELTSKPSMLGGAENLGVATQNNVAALVDNYTVAREDAELKKARKMASRIEMESFSKLAKVLDAELVSKRDAIQQNLDLLSTYKGLYSIESDKEYFVNQLDAYWQHTPKGSTVTGRAFIKLILSSLFEEYTLKTKEGKSLIDSMLDTMGASVLEFVLGNPINTPSKALDDFGFKILENRDQVYLTGIEKMLSIRGKLVSAYNTVKYQESADEEGNEIRDFYSVMRSNPYLLPFLDSRFNIMELDRLARLYNVDIDDPTVSRLRDVAYIHHTIVDGSMGSVSGDNTVLPLATLTAQLRLGFQLTEGEFDFLKYTGYALKPETLVNLSTYTFKDVCLNGFKSSPDDWKAGRAGGKTVYFKKSKQDKSEALTHYIESGLGITFTAKNSTWISDYSFLQKELYIYNKLFEMAKNNKRRPVTPEAKRELIARFEAKQAEELGVPDFKLEYEQGRVLDISHLPVCAVTGPAGSGKTTTAELFVMGLEELHDIPTSSIMFAAPTGRAASRLKEVVKRKTSTLHSTYRISEASYGIELTGNIHNKRMREDIVCLIIDEGSMINLDVMYTVLKRTPTGAMVVFMGDVEQLPPIGFGKPYANMLDYIPTIRLLVSKRATEQSLITANAKQIINNSNQIHIPDLVDGVDFRLKHTTDAQLMADILVDICRYHVHQITQHTTGAVIPSVLTHCEPVVLDTTLTIDDIQVVTPINGREWGVTALNKRLQPIFNPSPKGTRVHTKDRNGNPVMYTQGDRVIHLENQTHRTRLIHFEERSFGYLDDDIGVLNGEIGKVLDVIPSKDLKFHMDSENEERLNKTFFATDDVYYIAVKYQGTDEKTSMPMEFVILYQAEVVLKQTNVVEVNNRDTKYIDLAYALTVHKLQGSQAKMILFCLQHINGFISRNMLYTAITRASKACYVLGDVLGGQSAIAKGRKIAQTESRQTTVDLFY